MSIHIEPVLTEKALNKVSSGTYTFWVPATFSKNQIKDAVSKIYAVDVTGVRTSKYKASTRTTMRRQKVTTASRKKAIVTLKSGQKIDVFAETKEK